MCAAPNNMTEQLRSRLEKHHQSHVLRFWDQLAPDDRQGLLSDLDLVDLDSLPDLVEVVRGAVDAGDDRKCEMAPPEVVDPAPRAAEANDRGLALLKGCACIPASCAASALRGPTQKTLADSSPRETPRSRARLAVNRTAFALVKINAS